MDSSKFKISENTNKARYAMSGFFSRPFTFFKRKKNLGNGHKNKDQTALDKKLVYSLSKSRIPSLAQLKYIRKYLSYSEAWILRISILIIIVSLAVISISYYNTHLQTIPIAGGEYYEALIGTPKNINPLYSIVNDVDNDISHLVYSSLFKRDKNGELIKDLVEFYEVSDDHKSYTITVKEGIIWHDGSNFSVDDIIFTFSAIKDAQYKSPLRSSFTGVEIDKINEQTIRFTLSDPYAAFLDLLTFGIIPGEIWYQIPPESVSLAELNLKPIGSGPYKFNKYIKDTSGNIKEYDLVVNEEYYGEEALIDVNFRFYVNFEEAAVALNDNQVDGISYLPNSLKETLVTPQALNFYKLNLPQLTAIFFNQNANPALAEKAVREALATAINKLAIVQESLNNEAYVINGPILPYSFAYYSDIKLYEYDERRAEELLEIAGWKSFEITAEELAATTTIGSNKSEEEEANETEDSSINPKQGGEETEESQIKRSIGPGEWRKKNNRYLIIKLTTLDRGENAIVANAIKEYWERIGVKVELELLSGSTVQADVIKPRNFEALFYGQTTGSDPDPYAFWHSSQVGENGLNIANFSHSDVDQLLEDARLISDMDIRREKYIEFQNIIAEEIPAIFMYSPTYLYVQNKIIKNFEVYNILYPSDRFANITEWYIKTGKKLVW